MKEIKAKKGFFMWWIMIIYFTTTILFIYDNKENNTQFIVFTAISLLPLSLMTWAYLTTKYHIDDRFLYYQSAFLKGKVAIADIKEIKKNKTLWVGTQKAALTTKGLIIKQKYDEIYIAPESNDFVVEELLKINPNIKVS